MKYCNVFIPTLMETKKSREEWLKAIQPIMLWYWLGKSLVFSPEAEFFAMSSYSMYCDDIKFLKSHLVFDTLTPVSRSIFYRKLEKMIDSKQFDRGPCPNQLLPKDLNMQPESIRRVKGKVFFHLRCDPSRLRFLTKPHWLDENDEWTILETFVKKEKCEPLIESLKNKYSIDEYNVNEKKILHTKVA